MQLVEQHVIDRTDPRYATTDAAAFASKNLYNAALYLVRQTFIFEHRYLNDNEIQKRIQSHEAYKALPAKVSQQVLMPTDIAHVIKERSFHILREEFAHLQRMPSRWTRSTFSSTAGTVSAQTMQTYIERQSKQ